MLVTFPSGSVARTRRLFASNCVVQGDRAIVSDDGERLMLTVYTADRRAAAATISPAAAVRLAGRLMAGSIAQVAMIEVGDIGPWWEAGGF